MFIEFAYCRLNARDDVSTDSVQFFNSRRQRFSLLINCSGPLLHECGLARVEDHRHPHALSLDANVAHIAYYMIAKAIASTGPSDNPRPPNYHYGLAAVSARVDG